MPFQLLREKLPTPHVRRRKMTPHAWRMKKAHTYGAGAVGKERGPRRRAPAPRQKGAKCQRPYRVENTGSLPNSAVKQRRARLVLGWGTAWESLGVLLAFFFPFPLHAPRPPRGAAPRAPPRGPAQRGGRQSSARPHPMRADSRPRRGSIKRGAAYQQPTHAGVPKTDACTPTSQAVYGGEDTKTYADTKHMCHIMSHAKYMGHL